MSADPELDIIIGRLAPGRSPLFAELKQRDLAVVGVMGLVADGSSLEHAARSLSADGRAVCLDDVLVAVGAFADRRPVREKLNGHSLRFVDESWTTLSAGQKCVLRRPPDPGKGHR